MHAYSQDLRERVLKAIERGDRPTSIAARFEVSREWVYQVKDRFKKEGLRHSFQIGGHRKSRLAPMEDQIRAWIKEEADITLSELCDRISKQGIDIKVPALWHQLDKWGLSFKKNSTRQRARARGRTGSST
jgi:transposase